MTAAKVLLIVEGSTDAAVAQQLLDRAVVESADWVEAVQLVHLREYIGPNGSYLRWKDAKSYVLGLDPRVKPRAVHGDFGGRRGPDAVQARWGRFAALASKADVTVWLRDADDQPQRVDPLREAAVDPPCPLAWGLPIPMIEAWFVGCFEPQTPAEEHALSKVRAELSFDPVTSPERLSAAGGKHPAKGVAARLGLDNPARRTDTLDRPLERTRSCAKRAGLPDFVTMLERVALAIVQLSV